MVMDNFGHPMYTTGMSARSAMIYLRTLRERHGFSRADLERLTEIDRKQFYRWEQEGDKLPDVSELGVWVRAVRASFRDIEVLLGEGDISDAAARAMADDRWEELQDPNNAGVQDAIDLISRLRARPLLLGRWIEYGERLIAGAGDSH
jgi:transcriptional regulator with XRE-family HTH domain